MMLICGYGIFTLLASTLALPTLMEDPLAKLEPEEKEVLYPFPPGVDLSNTSESWSEAVVIRIYYDCQGRLVRQELSKLRTRNTDGMRVEELQDVQRGAPENETAKVSDIPVSFPSIKSRFKFPKHAKSTTTRRPQILEQPDQNVPSIVDKDMIIDTPIRSCPEGQNFDMFNKCRKEFPEKNPQQG
ncbi:uncharacterized protein LOC124368079 [Homalodisca vitripennis]|uniref:uncharacterized protein LOC124368079 n=1 Tax=Homalodisca vitripennis TaxID=197043 RepID=UPI001EEC33DE|nr:uncharacterized protein LOC124368079 [Homalodisca vitripennis]